MLFLFAFFLGGFPLSDVVTRFKFHFTSSRCTGILRLYGQSLSRLGEISVASTRIPRGTPGRPGLHINATAKITVNYLQAGII